MQTNIKMGKMERLKKNALLVAKWTATIIFLAACLELLRFIMWALYLEGFKM